MPDSPDEEWEVDVSRMTIAEAADFLREYQKELQQAGVADGYVNHVAKTVTELDSALGHEQDD